MSTSASPRSSRECDVLGDLLVLGGHLGDGLLPLLGLGRAGRRAAPRCRGRPRPGAAAPPWPWGSAAATRSAGRPPRTSPPGSRRAHRRPGTPRRSRSAPRSGSPRARRTSPTRGSTPRRTPAPAGCAGCRPSSAPRMTTVSTLSLSAMASSSAQNVRHRMLGSMPCISTMSRSRARRPAVRDPHRRPHQLAGDAVDLPDHRAVHLVVVVGLVVDLDDRLGLPDRVQVLQRVTGRVTGVVPALEGRDDDGVVQFGQVGRACGRSHPTGSLRQRKPCVAAMSPSHPATVGLGRPTTLSM